MGVTSADTASATTLCAGNKSLRSTEPESSLRPRRDGGHSTHRFYQRHAWRWRGFIQGGAELLCIGPFFPCSATTGLGRPGHSERSDPVRSHTARARGSRQAKDLLTAFVVNDASADPFEAGTESWARPSAWAIKMGHQDMVALLNEHGY